MHDVLTELPGIDEFRKQLFTTVEHNKKGDTSLALLIIKLAHFHDINTSFGYKAGDLLLKNVTNRITTILRTQDKLYRIGDSTFALILPELKTETIALLAANKIIQQFDERISVDGNHIKVNLKVGVSLYPHHTDDATYLVQYADMALETALNNNQPLHFYEPGDSERNIRSHALELKLSCALENNEFIMLYQPQYDLSSRKICGMEALLRWQPEGDSVITPDIFIPMAEKNALILPITLWTFNAAMRQCNWLAQHRLNIPVSINLSASTLNAPDLDEHIISAMNIWGISPGKLVLEVTESALMQDPVLSLRHLQLLHDTGISLSIDDFGTGYSSLSYLSRLPVHELKIDKSFVMNMLNNDDDLKIVRSIIELAHNFELTVIAEGVEDEATLNELARLGCDRGQGYFFGRPMPAEALLHLATASSVIE